MITKNAFTLAEILSVLVILGVVATLAIASVYPKYQERILLTQLKRTYSLLANSYDVAVVVNGSPTNWGMTQNSTAYKNNQGYTSVKTVSKDSSRVAEILYSNLNYTEQTINNYDTKYLGDLSYNSVAYDKEKVPENIPRASFYVLKNGTFLSKSVWIHDYRCQYSNGKINNICGDFSIDVNGAKGPNTIGKDKFFFWLTDSGIVPVGENGETFRSIYNRCDRNNKTLEYNGYGCTAWALYKGNMDYLHKNVRW